MARMMDAAHTAPHHFPCHQSHRVTDAESVVPWRFYALDGAACREIRVRVTGLEGPIDTTLGLLGAADGLIVVTWLPDPADAPAMDALFDPTRRNMEHIAAAAAAVQNMLLVATEAGTRTFWSSGGPILQSDVVRTWLGIPSEQVMLAAVYLYPPVVGDAVVKPGARRAFSGSATDCTSWVSV